MKKFTLFTMLLLACISSHAQLSYEAIGNYGRIYDLCHDLTTENKMYALSLNNHIVVSYDDGSTWDSFYAYPDISAQLSNLKILPDNETLCFSVINLSNEQNGIYVLNIADNTIVNFIALPDPEENPYIADFDIYDAEGTTMILKVHTDMQDKVYYTTTSGESWSVVYEATEHNNVSVAQVAISPANPSKLYITRGGGPDGVNGGLFISTDAGETWTEKLAGVVLDPIAISPVDANTIITGTGYLFGDVDENLYRSIDGGTTWTIMPVEWTDLATNNILVIAFHPIVPNIIFVLEENEIVYTENNGDTWSSTVYEENEYYAGLSLAVNPFASKGAVISTNNYPKRTDDGGATLTQVEAPFYTVNSVSVTKFGENEHLYYAAQGGHLHKNYNTGMTDTYNTSSPEIFNPGSYFIIADPYNEGRVYTYKVSNTGGTLYISNDNGATRTSIFNNDAPAVRELVVDPQNNNIIYMLADNWGSMTLYKLNITNLENVVSETITAPVADAIISGLLVNGSNLVLTQGDKVYKSSNSGSTWTVIYTASSQILDIDRNPFNDDKLAIGTEAGVFTSADNGTTWTSSLEDTFANKVKYSDVEDGVMAVGIFNNGDEADHFIKYYNGTDWVTVSAGEMNYLYVLSMDFNFVGDKINAYAGTNDMAIVRYSFTIGELGTNNPVATANTVIMAPNPASSFITLKAAGSLELKNTTIYSLTGQKVLESNQQTIDISQLSEGIYMVRTQTANGTTVTNKLVKK
jgi:xyloglucan-specific exo-beta-1,4-glucanase